MDHNTNRVANDNREKLFDGKNGKRLERIELKTILKWSFIALSAIIILAIVGVLLHDLSYATDPMVAREDVISGIKFYKHIILISLALLVVVIGAMIAIYLSNERGVRREQAERLARAVEQEYNKLEEEYRSIVEVIVDSDYSDSFRQRYIRELSTLLDDSGYMETYTELGIPSVISRIEEKRAHDLATLHTKAQTKILQESKE